VLRTALAASPPDARLLAFDPAGGEWHDARTTGDLFAVAAQTERGPRSSRAQAAKRAVFPATLWESGRRPMRALASGAHSGGPWDGLVVLHTTYLAPLAPWLQARGARVLLHVYDLVWRAHELDAQRARGPLRAIRSAYATTVRPREERAVAAADAVVVAGWDDWLALRSRVPAARWVAPGVPAPAPAPPNGRSSELRVGLLGNFHHGPTLESARTLLSSPLAREAGARVVLAGLGSDSGAAAGRPQVDALGPVASVEEFYERVDCVIVPVESGAGIKVKLAEAALAGMPVVTTTLGAAGYPPELRERLLIEDDPARLTVARCRELVAGFDRAGTRAAFAGIVGFDAAVTSYRSVLDDVERA
jgi:hypothetical protein